MSFQATEWARSLPLPSSSAKFTLMTIGSYADTDGACFPSLTRLAGDTVQSVASVRRRIRELEQLGLVQRLARWISPDQRIVVTRIGDTDQPKGYRQTSDELRLQMDVTAAELRRRLAEQGQPAPTPIEIAEQIADELAAENEAADQGGEGVNLAGGEGVNLAGGGCHSSAGGRVSEPCDPLKRNPNSSAEESPKSPSGDGVPAAPDGLQASEPGSPITDTRHWAHRDSWQRFERAWHEPIINQRLCRQLWGGLSDDDRELLIGKVAPGYRAWRQTQARPPTVCNAEKILRERDAWNSYARFAPAADAAQAIAKPPTFAALDSDAGRAWYVLIEIGQAVHDRVDRGAATGYLVTDPLPPAIAALAAVKTRTKEWPHHPIGSGECGAWRTFVGKHLRRAARLRKDDNGIDGIRAPRRWPPRVDGSWPDDQQTDTSERIANDGSA